MKARINPKAIQKETWVITVAVDEVMPDHSVESAEASGCQGSRCPSEASAKDSPKKRNPT